MFRVLLEFNSGLAQGVIWEGVVKIFSPILPDLKYNRVQSTNSKQSYRFGFGQPSFLGKCPG